jgi:phosphoenolpyruvate carboxykinase (ATP)
MGVKEPEATFSSCFGGPFLVWHPNKYAELLAAKIKQHGTRVWLVNTGRSGGAYGTGKRIKLANTRAIIDAIHSGALVTAKTQRDPVFGFDVVTECPNVPAEILIPSRPGPACLYRLSSTPLQNFSSLPPAIPNKTTEKRPMSA